MKQDKINPKKFGIVELRHLQAAVILFKSCHWKKENWQHLCALHGNSPERKYKSFPSTPCLLFHHPLESNKRSPEAAMAFKPFKPFQYVADWLKNLNIHKEAANTIWESPAASIRWRNMSQAEKLAYKILADPDPEDSISFAVQKFIGVDKYVLVFGDQYTSVEEALRNCQVILFNENDGELAEVIKKHEYCQVMMLTEAPTKKVMKTISSVFLGDKVICTFTPHRRQNFKYFFPGFEEVAIGNNNFPWNKFYIRTFVDKIGSPDAAQWFINTLNLVEQEEYSVMTPAELQHYETYGAISFDPKSEEEEKIWNVIDSIKNYSIVGAMGERMSADDQIIIINQKLRAKIGYHTPKKIEIEAVMRFIGTDSVVGVFSGKACIENLLRMRNVNVIATDNYSTMDNKEGQWMEVKQIDAIEAVRLYCNDKQVLLMSWPELRKENNDHSDAFHVLREFKGQKLIYFGELAGYCCACDGFFNLLKDEFHYVNSKTEGPDDKFTYSSLHFYIRL